MSKQKKAGASFTDKFLAAVLSLAAVGVGFYLAPLIVQASIVAGIVLILVTWSGAKASGMSVPELLGLCLGKALIGGFKGVAIGLIEWPLRAGHRAAARFEVRLRVELTAARAAYRCLDGTVALVAAAAARTRRLVSTQAAEAVEVFSDAAGELVDPIRETA